MQRLSLSYFQNSSYSKRFQIYLLLAIFGFIFPTSLLSQSNFDQSTLQGQKWNIDKYIWSHTDSRSAKDGKTILNYAAIDNWLSLPAGKDVSISPDGKYVGYVINRFDKPDSLVVQSITGDWRQSFASAEAGFFSADSKQYIFRTKEGLCFLSVSSGNILYEKAVIDYKIPAKNVNNGKTDWVAWQLTNKEVGLKNLFSGALKRVMNVANYDFDKSGQWLVCQVNNETKELLIYHLATSREIRFSSVDAYTFNANGNTLLLKTVNKAGDTTIASLEYISLSNESAANREIKTIWSTRKPGLVVNNCGFDNTGKQVVFTIQDNSKNNSIWYWQEGMAEAVMKLNNYSDGIPTGSMLEPLVTFSKNGHYICFYHSIQPTKQVVSSDAVQVDVWSYQDEVIQSSQAKMTKEPVKFLALLDLSNGHIIDLENDGKKVVFGNDIPGKFVLKATSFQSERFWETANENDSFYLISLHDKRKRYLPTTGKSNYTSSVFKYSPDGHYLLFFNGNNGGNYFSYDLDKDILTNISDKLRLGLLASKNLYLRSNRKAPATISIYEQLIGWLADENAVLVSDGFDIWQLDLAGKKAPINITNGYGRLHQTVFQLSGDNPGIMEIFHKKDAILLRAFNRKNKYNGYYRKELSKKGNPELLYMGPCFMEKLDGITAFAKGMKPIKAADSNTWLVQRQTATEAPNYFVTRDFKTFQAVTHLHPQKFYNWLTTELHSFKQLDGTTSQGVLYKPENFNPTQKYPVIVAFYGSPSDHLFQYPQPEYFDSPNVFDNPAWMVSHGYLVFVPDIYFIEGNWGQSTMNAVDGAAQYLKTLEYVDGKHLGLCGHSNSGRMGYYLFNHSRSFAAMSLGSGYGGTDILSLTLSEGGRAFKWAEKNTFGTGLGNIWQNKKTWIDHIAVLQIDKATNPLLLFHCTNDGDDVRLARELFNALWRQEKPLWWLNYKEGDHVVRGKEAKDFTLRYTQYFDHYLKEAPAPRWMTPGIPAKLKTIEARYDLDAAGTCDLPDKKQCNICGAWNKQHKRNPGMFEKPIAEWHLDKDIEAEMSKKETQAYNEKMKKGEAQHKETLKQLQQYKDYKYPGQ